MNSLDIKQLAAFRAVMERGSATAAAQFLGVTQPAVSTLLGKLERDTGLTLFIRAHRRLVPTAEATAFLGGVVDVLERHERLSETAQDIQATRAGSLTIASHPGPSIAWLPSLIAAFLKERPGVTVRLISRQSQAVRDLIPSGTFDLAVAELPVAHPLITVRRFRMAFVAVVAKTSPLARHAVLTPKILDGQPFISMFKGHAAQVATTKAFGDSNARLHVVAECDYLASAIALARCGAGVAVVDPMSAEELHMDGLAIRPFQPSAFYDFAVFRPADRPPSKLARSFASAVETRISGY